MGRINKSYCFLSGCNMFGPKMLQSYQAIDPPPLTGQTKDQPTSNAKGQTSKNMQKVYVADNDGYIVPWSIELQKSDGNAYAKQVMAYMIKGGEGEKVLPKGLHPVLPQGTKVLGLKIKDGVATVDFSPEFKKYKAEDERKIVDAVTWALTEFDNVKEVSIWINGTPLDVMPVKGTPVSRLSRQNGINVEISDNVKLGQTQPVTLYMQGQLSEKQTYFVPVTRLIPRTNDVATAVIKELLKGPSQESALFSSLLPTVNVLSVKKEKDTLTVNFDNKILSYNQGEANPDALEAVILSLTENTDAKKIQLLVDGKKNLKAGKEDYTKPVTRPNVINPGAY